MKYKSNTWYTVQITMHAQDETGKNIVYEMFDFNDVSLKMFHEKIFVQGFRIDLNPGVTWEWIDPLRIQRVIIITQPGRYSLE